MTVGLSTYAFFWQHSPRVRGPLDLLGMVERTASAGADALQICDYSAVEAMSRTEISDLHGAAEDAGIVLELGVRGIRVPQLERFLTLADGLGARLVRTMVGTKDDRPSVGEAVTELRRVVPQYAADDVTIALETYELFSSSELIRVVEEVGDPHLGICLDPANMVARLEDPRTTIDRVAEHVVNLHVKDFRFERAPGLVGFALTGCLLGTGLLDLDYLYERVRPQERGISQIVEHWLPWQEDGEVTVRMERQWTAHSLATVRAMQA